MAAGARLAEPGEFTLRAYLNGRIDLVQAEAVQDLVDAVTPLQARAAFDQLEGTLTARIREIDAALFDLSRAARSVAGFSRRGLSLRRAGAAAARDRRDRRAESIALLADARPRAAASAKALQVVDRRAAEPGKSSLFNRLAGAGRAIVTDIPGTTRDLVTEVVDIDGLAITLVDTAGLHGAPADAVEARRHRARAAARGVADLTIVVLDASRPLEGDDRDAAR